MNNFIVIEGLDGSGKSTQIKMLLNYLDLKKIEYKYLHFPRSGEGYYGDLIAKFLRGELGGLEDIDPYLVSLIYAGDRNDAKRLINQWVKNDFLVVVDRYVYSNVAFQCAKIKNPKKKEVLEKWILDFEYDYNRIPKPCLSFYLDVPFEFINNQLSKQRNGKERAYLNGKNDIHESSLPLQKLVENEYNRLIAKYNDLFLISCITEENGVLPPKQIHDRILKKLKTSGIL